MPVKRNAFQVLCLSPGATDEEIARVYKALVLHWHPDRNQDPDAQRRTAELNEAYAELMDPDRRRRHRLSSDAAEPAVTPGSPSEPAPPGGGDPPWTPPPGAYRRPSSRAGDPSAYSRGAYGDAGRAPHTPPPAGCDPWPHASASPGAQAWSRPSSPYAHRPPGTTGAAARAPLSPDGRYWWDGYRWVPVTVPATTAAGGDGLWWPASGWFAGPRPAGPRRVNGWKTAGLLVASVVVLVDLSAIVAAVAGGEAVLTAGGTLLVLLLLGACLRPGARPPSARGRPTRR